MSDERERVARGLQQPEELTLGEGGGDDPAARLGELERERDEYLDALRRLKAEFDNYRKRVARERAHDSARAAERLVKQLLPLGDDLDRALEAAAEHGEQTVADGVRLVRRALEAILEREGVVEVPTDGRFDPHLQEALLSQPSEEPEGTVIQVLQKGYKLGDHVLRPARVVISAGVPDLPRPRPGDGDGDGDGDGEGE